MNYLVEKLSDGFTDSSNYYLPSNPNYEEWRVGYQVQAINNELKSTWLGKARLAGVVIPHHADQWAEIQITELFTVNDHCSFMLRGAYDEVAWPERNQRAYIVSCRFDGIIVERHNDDDPPAYLSLTPMDTSAMVAGDVIRGEILGNNLKVFKNGTLLLDIIDNSIATGQPAITQYTPNDSNTGIGDNFRCGELLRMDSLTITLNGDGDIDLVSTVNDTTGRTIFWVLTNSSTTPTEEQIVAGEDHLGNAATMDGSEAVTALEHTINITSVPNNQTLYAHAAVVDTA